jgi:hypothetical protein
MNQNSTKPGTAEGAGRHTPDLTKRLAEPADGDQPVASFEMQFGTTTWITPGQMRRLYELFDEVVSSPVNQPVDGVHWLSGSGSKPHFSKADAAFLGKPVAPDAPDSGEPTFDNSVLFFESTARGFVSDRERAKKLKQRSKQKEPDMVRAKFMLTEVTDTAFGGKRFKFAPQYDPSIPEDQRFAKASPTGEFWMQVDNPAAIEQLQLNQQYYFDITPAPAQP